MGTPFFFLISKISLKKKMGQNPCTQSVCIRYVRITKKKNMCL